MNTLAIAAATLAMISVQGHRGARGEFPENTLPAFEAALHAGVDVLELDVLVTKDRKLVVGHDPVVNANFCQFKDGARLKNRFVVFHKTISEVQELDCGTLVNANFKDSKRIPGAKMPTLEEVFDLVKNSSNPKARIVQFNIETKFSDDNPEEESPTPKEFTQLLVNSIESSGIDLNRFIIQSFVWDTLNIAKQMNSKIKTAALFTVPAYDIWTRIDALKPDILSPRHDELTERFVKTAKEKKYPVIPWTANDEATWQKLIDLKVDGIITDYPTRLLKFLGRPAGT